MKTSKCLPPVNTNTPLLQDLANLQQQLVIHLNHPARACTQSSYDGLQWQQHYQHLETQLAQLIQKAEKETRPAPTPLTTHNPLTPAQIKRQCLDHRLYVHGQEPAPIQALAVVQERLSHLAADPARHHDPATADHFIWKLQTKDLQDFHAQLLQTLQPAAPTQNSPSPSPSVRV